MTYARMAQQNEMPYVPVEGSQGEPTQDYISRQLYKIGQVGPSAEADWMKAHGRYLSGIGGLGCGPCAGKPMSGLGGENETQAPWDPEFRDGFMRELEREDDVYGSGIFDTYGRPGTVHPDMGLFADNPSVPGYIDREILYKVSPEISDITNGARVVVVAPGGMTYQEKNGRSVDFEGDSPCPPMLRPELAPGIEDVYASMSPTPPIVAAPLLPPGVGPKFVPLPGPAASPYTPPVPKSPSGTPSSFTPIPFDRTSREVPFVNRWTPAGLSPSKTARMPAAVPGIPFQQVPMNRASTRIGSRSIVNTGVAPAPFHGRSGPQVPMSTSATPVPTRDISRTGDRALLVPAPQRRRVSTRPAAALRGFGVADAAPADTGIGVGTFLFAGAVLGVGAAMVYGAVKMKG